MSTHNICFCGGIKKISALLGCKKCLIKSYGGEMSDYLREL